MLGLAVVYQGLGDEVQATTYYQQAREIAHKFQVQAMEGLILLTLGDIAYNQGKADKTIELAQQAIGLFEQSKSPALQEFALQGLATGYGGKQNYPAAITAAQAALGIAKTLGDRSSESGILSQLGYLHRKAGQTAQAMQFYQASIAADPTPELPGSSSGNYLGLARIYRRLNHPVTAIAYYKKAVSGVEQVRRKIAGLPPQLQQAFLHSGREGNRTADTYRELADLLLEQGRVPEAQAVLDLLKVQELKDFRQERGSGKTPELACSQTEAKILQDQGSLIAFGQKLRECEKANCPQLNQLYDQRKDLTRQYNRTITSLEQALRDRRRVDPNAFDPNKLGKINAIVNAQPHTVLISPLVLENKIWLVWASAGGVVKSVEVPVQQKDLALAVKQFRDAMRPGASSKEAQIAGKQLYDWLIKPLEPELQANQVENLVFALDRVMRYVPMAALFDGKQLLIERYTISAILAADLTDTRDRLSAQNSSILALGASLFVGFNDLPNVPKEINAIVRSQPQDTHGVYPGQKYLNREFDEYALQRIAGHNILHIASHAEFVRGRPENSYLVLGNSKKLTIPEIKDLLSDLNHLQLVVLSACNTALGGESDGVEISGISSYFLNAGAKTVLASLWSVNDASTSLLMQRFYRALAQSSPAHPITRAQALRLAQLSLLYGQEVTFPPQRGMTVVAPPVTQSKHEGDRPTFANPFYWAPFILIGNAL